SMELLRERITAATLTRRALARSTNTASINSSGKREPSRTGHSKLNFWIQVYRHLRSRLANDWTILRKCQDHRRWKSSKRRRGAQLLPDPGQPPSPFTH